MNIRLITSAGKEPVSLDEARRHLRIDDDITEDDDDIRMAITAARERAEHLTERSLMSHEWELTLDEFIPIIELPKPPIVTVSSVKFLDSDGVEQILPGNAYIVDRDSEPGRLVPAYGKCWPNTRRQINAVRVRYSTGYGSPAAIPQAVKSWMLLRIGLLYKHRESVVTGVSIAPLPFVDCMLDAQKIWSA